MTLPRFCKICRLILNYPDLKKDDYDNQLKLGRGYCPSKHYEIALNEYEDRNEVLYERFSYQDYAIQISYNDGTVYLHKDSRLVLQRPIAEFENWNYRDVNYILNKLDTLVNFS